MLFACADVGHLQISFQTEGGADAEVKPVAALI